jgi:hypothetical protein
MTCYSQLLPKGLTTTAIEELSHYEIKFVEIKSVYSTLTPMEQLMPIYLSQVKVLTPLFFTFTSIGENSGTPSDLLVIDGQFVNTVTQDQPHYRLTYSWLEFGVNHQTTLEPGALLKQNSISQSFNVGSGFKSYLFTIQSEIAEGLTIHCRHPNFFKNFEEIQNILKGIIEIK